MPRSVYARAAARGFPVFDVSGQSGQGALPDSTAPPPRAGLPADSWTDPNQDAASQPAPAIPPEVYVLGGLMWGLPAAANPDNTPRTHAAPFADPTLPRGEYYAEAEAAHARVFTGVAERQPVALATMSESRQRGQGSSADNLQQLSGQIRMNAGLDAVQGYGGGGPGPGGVNSVQGPTTDIEEFGGETYTTFVSAAEVPFLHAVPDQFIADAAELPPYMPRYDGPTASVSAQDTVGTDVPATGPALSSQGAAWPASFWG